jgi:predicted nucleic acid-binding protein
VSLFVDTSVWSLAWRRDHVSSAPEVSELERALKSGDSIYATGLILQELLQGFSGPRAQKKIIDYFSALPLLVADRQDHIQAADLRNACRRKGKQVGMIDALLAQLCIRYDLVILTTDKDFQQIASVVSLSVWTP